MVKKPATMHHFFIILLILLAGCKFPHVSSRQHNVFSRTRDGVVHVGQFTQDADGEIDSYWGVAFL
jgi:hypothetical protein